MSKPIIAVESLSATKFRVTITEGSGSSTHEVSVTPTDVQKYAPGSTPEALLRASFAFLLEREPKESILSRFALPDIERYFPDFPKKIRQPL